MHPGQMDRNIEIMRRTDSPLDRFGEAPKEAVVVWTAYAGRRQTSGREFLAAGEVTPEKIAVFMTRWIDIQPPLTAGDLVRCDGQTWDILEVRELGRRAGLELKCKALGEP
jgi:head-tail adaptor